MKSLKTENLLILFVWWFVFMVVLPWDQEKIVVLNLILFMYFLYFMINVSLTDTLNSKKDAVLSILKSSLTSNMALLHDLLKNVQILENLHSSLLLSLIKKYLSSLVNYFNKVLSSAFNKAGKNLIFISLLSNFLSSKQSILLNYIQKELFVSKQILDSKDNFFSTLEN